MTDELALPVSSTPTTDTRKRKRPDAGFGSEMEIDPSSTPQIPSSVARTMETTHLGNETTQAPPSSPLERQLFSKKSQPSSKLAQEMLQDVSEEPEQRRSEESRRSHERDGRKGSAGGGMEDLQSTLMHLKENMDDLEEDQRQLAEDMVFEIYCQLRNARGKRRKVE
jgi:hypothetical protein